ncbi:HOIL1 protein, partial [Podargus strigoides]|nr:HOIL1 protein [Podargus strigoides]
RSLPPKPSHGSMPHLGAPPAAQVFQDYGFHPLVQRWIIGQCLCVDERTVSSYGIRRDGDTAFLYLLSAKMAELTEQRYEEDQAQLMLSSTSSPPAAPGERRKYNTLPSMSPKKGWGSEAGRKMDISDISQHLDTLQLGDLLGAQPRPADTNLPSPVPAGWSCPKCTFINKPTRPGCEMCSTERPEDYVVPGGHAPDESELWRMQQEQEGILQYQQVRGHPPPWGHRAPRAWTQPRGGWGSGGAWRCWGARNGLGRG